MNQKILVFVVVLAVILVLVKIKSEMYFIKDEPKLGELVLPVDGAKTCKFVTSPRGWMELNDCESGKPLPKGSQLFGEWNLSKGKINGKSLSVSSLTCGGSGTSPEEQEVEKTCGELQVAPSGKKFYPRRDGSDFFFTLGEGSPKDQIKKGKNTACFLDTAGRKFNDGRQFTNGGFDKYSDCVMASLPSACSWYAGEHKDTLDGKSHEGRICNQFVSDEATKDTSSNACKVKRIHDFSKASFDDEGKILPAGVYSFPVDITPLTWKKKLGTNNPTRETIPEYYSGTEHYWVPEGLVYSKKGVLCNDGDCGKVGKAIKISSQLKKGLSGVNGCKLVASKIGFKDLSECSVKTKSKDVPAEEKWDICDVQAFGYKGYDVLELEDGNNSEPKK
jgi:hypothetical protein